MAVRVRLAVRTLGSRNSGTALLTASTPVIAVVPLANDRISSQAGDAHGSGNGPRQRREGTGWPWARSRADEAHYDHQPERGDEQIRRRQEQQPGLPDPAQVDDGEEHQDPETQWQRVGQERRYGRDDRPHTGRDSDGDIEDVIERQRAGRE